MREEYTEADTCIRCPHCGAPAWFSRPRALAAGVICPAQGCGRSFVWDRWVSRDRGVDRGSYLYPRIPGLLESMMQRSWEIVGLGLCLLVFVVPLAQAGLASAVTQLFATAYFTGMGMCALGFGLLQRRRNRLLAATRTDARTHALRASPTIRAVASAGWSRGYGSTSSKHVSQRRPSAV